MDFITQLLKTAVAVAMVVALFAFGAFIFLILLGLALVIALVVWLKRKGVISSAQQTTIHEQATHSTTSQPFSPNQRERVTIIEGEAVEVKKD